MSQTSDHKRASSTLLLTRPEAQSQAFLRECERALGIEIPVVISPLLAIEPVEPLPDLTAYTTIILTSANAVKRLGGALCDRDVVTVGEVTADLAASLGARARALGQSSDDIVASATEVRPPAIHLHGRHTTGEIARRLTDTGIPTDEAIVYDQVAVPLTEKAMSLLNSSKRIVAPIFSSRTAALLSKAVGQRSNMVIVTMSAAVAECWEGDGEIVISPEPTAAAMCDATIRVI